MNFNKVIIMTDLDGTLLDDKKQIAEKDIEAIERFRAGGGHFTIATGRGHLMARGIVEKLNIHEPCVIFNGAAVYDFDEQKFLWHSDMPKCARTYIKDLQDNFPDIGIEILCEDIIYVTRNNPTVVEHMKIESLTPTYADIDDVPDAGWLKVLIAYPPERIDTVIEYTKKHCADNVNWVHSSPMYYEMLPEGISKGAGYKKLLAITGRENLFTAAAGDFGNDRDMVRDADLGVAVANALDSVKEVAKLVVCDNNHAPMSKIIEYIEKL